SAIGSILVPIGESFNIGVRTQSIVFPFNYFGQIVIVFFIGYFADKFGKKITHIISIFLLGLFALLFKFINSFPLLLAVFLFTGIFGISINTISDAVVSDSFEKRKGIYLNIAHVFFSLGAMTSPVIFNLVFSRTSNFRTIYFILFFMSFVILFLVAVAKYPQKDGTQIRPAIIFSILKNHKLITICIFATISFGTLHAVAGWIPTLFQKNLNISEAFSNYSLSIFWFAVTIGRILVATLSKKLDEITLMKWLNILAFCFLAISFFLNSYLLLTIDYFIFGIVVGGLIPLIIAYSAKIYPEHSSTRIATVFSFGATGMLIIPMVIGMLGEYFAISKTLSFTSALFLAYMYILQKKLH
ncbi:MAG: MFS transporter, partial [Actinobacteria bacterium]|nr:MFS transporter [Actinomycetota bacterium]